MALTLVGDRVTVPTVFGAAPSVNLDFAASAPALDAVRDAVDRFLPWYSSVHRGTGYKSQVSTRAYEDARASVARFLGARPDDAVVFTRNTTDALNLLASALADDAVVVTFDGEHHANLLPWRRRPHRWVRTAGTPQDTVAALEAALASLRRTHTGDVLVATTAVSNVTGELWPVDDVVRVARLHGARVAVDAAQLAPHAPVDLAGWGADWVAVSGHKLYAPYGAGALVGRADWLAAREPFLAGGGAVRFVTMDDVAWTSLPDRQEAGSPNVVGAVALAAACDALAGWGMDRVFAHDVAVAEHARRRLAKVPGLRLLGVWDEDHPRVAVVTFTLDAAPHGLVAAALSAEHAIAVRDGCFCAHPLLLRLLGVDEGEADRVRAAMLDGDTSQVPGAVRASGGLTTTAEDYDLLADALEALAADGPRWTYRPVERSSAWVPDPDPRFPDPPDDGELLGCRT